MTISPYGRACALPHPRRAENALNGMSLVQMIPLPAHVRKKRFPQFFGVGAGADKRPETRNLSGDNQTLRRGETRDIETLAAASARRPYHGRDKRGSPCGSRSKLHPSRQWSQCLMSPPAGLGSQVSCPRAHARIVRGGHARDEAFSSGDGRGHAPPRWRLSMRRSRGDRPTCGRLGEAALPRPRQARPRAATPPSRPRRRPS